MLHYIKKCNYLNTKNIEKAECQLQLDLTINLVRCFPWLKLFFTCCLDLMQE